MQCIKCGYTTEDENDIYCQNCGHEFNSNYCTNDLCYQRNNGERIPCNEDACYCPSCGAETEYFKEGLISPKNYNSK